MKRLYTPESHALAAICREWYLAFGFLTVAVVISLWLSPTWMPLVDLGLAIALMFIEPGRKSGSSQPCGRIRFVTALTLILTCLISLAINLSYKTEFIHLFFDISTLNHSIPYITSLILFPVCAVISGFMLIPQIRQRHLHHCYLHNEYNPSHPLYGRMVHATYKSLLQRLAVMTAIISVIDWGYYFICYENTRINRPDSFFFFIVPAAIYVWSIIFVRQSYSMLMLSNGQTIRAENLPPDDMGASITDSSVLRFLVVHNGQLLLNTNQQELMDCAVDTPFVAIGDLNYEGNLDEARKIFNNRSGIDSFKIKLLYTNHTHTSNNKIFHFLITLPEETSNIKLPGQWITIDNLDRMLKMGVLSPQLAGEFFRIYTIAMAWKTYDRRGRRRYPIRNYRPNFRLGELHELDADYNDIQWLRVARINQDSPFWFIRKFLLSDKKSKS